MHLTKRHHPTVVWQGLLELEQHDTGSSTTSHNTCPHRRIRIPRGEVRGRRRFLLFFLVLLFPCNPRTEAPAGSVQKRRRDLMCQKYSSASPSNSRTQHPGSALSSCSERCSSSSASSFLLACSALAVRRTASPDAPASTGRLSVGWASAEECRRLRSLLCGPGSARMPGRTASGGAFSRRGASFVSYSSTSLVFCPRGAAFCCISLRTSTLVECSCQSHADGLLFVPEHRTQPPLTTSPCDSTSCGSLARLTHEKATRTKSVTKPV